MSFDNFTTTVTYREIPECEGHRFGSDGTAWSCWGRGRSSPTGPWLKMSPTRQTNGHLGLRIHVSGKLTPVRLHDMMCWAFHGDRPLGTECIFRDGNRDNLSPDNIFWGIDPENIMDPSVEYREISESEGYLYGADGSIWSSWQRGADKPTDVWRRLILGVNPSGHLQLRVKIDGKLTMVGAHHMTCWAFNGRCPDGLECCHKDGIANHNTPGNLYWGTRQDNIDDQRRHGVFCAFGRYQPPRIAI